MKEDIINWLDAGADFHVGCELFCKYSQNNYAKKYVFISKNNFPAIRTKLKIELCRLADIEFNPLNPEDVKKKSERTGSKSKAKKKTNRKRRTPNTEQQTLNTEHATPNTEQNNTEQQTPSSEN